MSLNDIIKDGGIGLFFILSIIQISPIKINPWTRIATWLGNSINSGVYKRLDKVESQLESHIKESNQEKMTTRRQRILRSADELIEGRNYSRERWNNLINDCDVYESYCKAHPEYPNSLATMAIQYIKTEYSKQIFS